MATAKAAAADYPPLQIGSQTRFVNQTARQAEWQPTRQMAGHLISHLISQLIRQLI
jgi:hypothetical protein